MTSGQQPATIRLFQITDFHLRTSPVDTLNGVVTDLSFRNVLKSLNPLEIKASDHILLTGDLAQDPDPITYQRLKSYLKHLTCPVYCLPGNHDDPETMNKALIDADIRYESQIELGTWTLICLDSTIRKSPKGRLSLAQLDLLESNLLSAKGDHIMIALHHHPIPCGSEWMDTMTVQNSDEFFHVLNSSSKVRAIVCGHIHQAFDRQQDNIRIIGTPSTCFQFTPKSSDFSIDTIPPGYRVLELMADGNIRTEVVRLNELPEGLDIGSSGY